MKDERSNLLNELEKIDTEERLKGLSIKVRMRNITPDVGQFLNILVKAVKAKTVLEIGTSNGYSTIWLGIAVEENQGELLTLEIDPRKIAMAKENLTKAKLLNTVKIIEGDGKKNIKKINKEFDFVFIDAEKEDYIEFFDLVLPKVKIGGIIVADNVLSHADILKNYMEYVRKHPQTKSILIPIGRGEELTIKIK